MSEVKYRIVTKKFRNNEKEYRGEKSIDGGNTWTTIDLVGSKTGWTRVRREVEAEIVEDKNRIVIDIEYEDVSSVDLGQSVPDEDAWKKIMGEQT